MTLDEIIIKYTGIANNYREKMIKYNGVNDSLYHRFRHRMQDLHSVIIDLRELKKLNEEVLAEKKSCASCHWYIKHEHAFPCNKCSAYSRYERKI